MNRYNYNRSDFEDEDPLLPTIQRLIEGALFICILLLIIAFMQNRDLEAKLDDQRAEFKAKDAEVKKYSGLLAECMNGGGMYDQASGIAYFCGKPLEIPL